MFWSSFSALSDSVHQTVFVSTTIKEAVFINIKQRSYDVTELQSVRICALFVYVLAKVVRRLIKLLPHNTKYSLFWGWRDLFPILLQIDHTLKWCTAFRSKKVLTTIIWSCENTQRLITITTSCEHYKLYVNWVWQVSSAGAGVWRLDEKVWWPTCLWTLPSCSRLFSKKIILCLWATLPPASSLSFSKLCWQKIKLQQQSAYAILEPGGGQERFWSGTYNLC